MGKSISSRLVVMASFAAAFMASPAMATNYDLGTLTANVGYGVGGPIASKSNPTDTIYFGLGTVDGLGAGLIQVPAIIFTPKITSYLTTVTADLYSATTNTLISHLVNNDTAMLTGLTPGAYYIKVSGVAVNPAVGGTYALGLLATRAASAPGPAGLLFVGGAAVLMGARRRRQQKRKPALALA